MTIYSYYLFFSFIFIIKCIQESDFKTIENPEKTYFKIDSNKEIFLIYNNPKKGGEISFEFENQNVYTLEVYIYTSISKIKKESQSYKDYDILFLSKNQNYFILNSTISMNDKLYIIIKDINNYYSSNILSIVNELEIKNLKLNEPWIIKKFLSKKELNGIFKGEINEKYIVSFVSDSNNCRIQITDNNNKTYEYNSSTIIKFNNSANNSYNINIKSNSHNISTISVIFYKTNPDELKNSVPRLYYYNRRLEFYYYVNLENLNENDDNSIIVNVDYLLIYEKKKIEFFGKFTDNKNDILSIEKYPNSTTERTIITKTNENDDTIFEIYYKKIKQSDKYLLLKINIGENTNNLKNYFFPEKFKIELSEFTNEKIDLTEYSFKRQIIRRIPQYFKFKKPKNSNIEYIIQSTSSDSLSLVYGDLINKNDYTLNNEIISGQIIKIDNNKKCDNYILILRGYTYADIYIMKIKKNYIYSFKERPLKIIEYDIRGLEKTYLINYYDEYNYFEKNLAVLHYEILSGQCEIFYKNELEGGINEYLPNELNNITGNITINLETNVDLFTINCTIPGRIKFNYIPRERKQFKLQDHYIKYFSLPSKIESKIIFPQFHNQKIYLFVENLSKKNVSFELSKKTYSLNENNNYQIQVEITIDNSLTDIIQITPNENTILSVFISSRNEYQVLKKEDEKKEIKPEKNYLLIQLEKNRNYKNLEVSFSSNENDIIYSLYNSKNDKIQFLPYPKGTSNNKILSKQSSLSIPNPYQYYHHNKTMNYYLIIQGEKLNNSKISFNYVLKNETKEKILFLNNNDTLFEIPYEENIKKKLYLFSYSYGTDKNFIQLELLDKDDKIYSQKLDNGNNIKEFSNLYYDLRIKGNFYKKNDYNCIIVNPFYLNDFNLTFFNEYKDLKINDRIDEKNNIILSWKNIDNSIYYMYRFPNNTNPVNLNNDCYLRTLNATKIEKNTFLINSTDKENEYYINIVAENKNYKYRIVYNFIKIDKKKNSNNDKNKNIIFYIIIIGSILIFIIIVYLLIIYLKRKNSQIMNDFKASEGLLPKYDDDL